MAFSTTVVWAIFKLTYTHCTCATRLDDRTSSAVNLYVQLTGSHNKKTRFVGMRRNDDKQREYGIESVLYEFKLLYTCTRS